MTATAAPSSTWTVVAEVSIRTSPPAATCSAQRSHIMPGPYFGYWNSSIRLVTCFGGPAACRPTRTGCGSHTAFHSDMPLIRWAPQSAEISEAGTAQTFSL